MTAPMTAEEPKAGEHAPSPAAVRRELANGVPSPRSRLRAVDFGGCHRHGWHHRTIFSREWPAVPPGLRRHLCEIELR